MPEPISLLAGRAIVVTGASRGIGRAIASRLSAFGADVLAVSRSNSHPPPIDGRIVPLCADLRDDVTPEDVVAAALHAFGHVDGLVNNAGVIHFDACWTHGDAEWDEVFATNLTAPFRLSQALVRHWLNRGEEAAIVNVGSIESEVAVERQVAYAASKGGIVGLTRAMAVELAPRGIRVNAVGPGVIDTGMSDTMIERTMSRIPMRRVGSTDEIGDVAAFLLSDMACYVTGAILFADGGYTAR